MLVEPATHAAEHICARGNIHDLVEVGSGQYPFPRQSRSPAIVTPPFASHRPPRLRRQGALVLGLTIAIGAPDLWLVR